MQATSRVQILSALANQGRLDILIALTEGEQCVNSLAERTGLSQPALSRHMRQLLNAGLVTMRTNGKYHLFALDEQTAAPFLSQFLATDIVPEALGAPADLMYTWDPATNEQRWFGGVDAAFGFEPGTFPRTVEAWEERIHPDDHARVMDAAKRHMTEQAPFFERYRIVHKDGTCAHWLDCGSVMRDEAGNPFKWVGMTREIPGGIDENDIAG